MLKKSTQSRKYTLETHIVYNIMGAPTETARFQILQ